MPTDLFVTKLIDNQNGDEILVADIDNVVDEYKAGAFNSDVTAADGAKVVDVGATRAASALYAGTAAITTTTGDLKGDVLAADNTKIVDSGATQGASVVTAGSIVGTLTGLAIQGGASVAATSGAVAIPITDLYSGYTTNATATIAATLADGVVGQMKIIKLETKDTNNMVVTPAHMSGGTTITFDATAEYAILIFIGTAWVVVATNATVA